MTDIKTIWNTDDNRGDWQAEAGGLVSGSDLETAILLSLFTDRLARDDDAIDDNDRRGWWGDSGEDYAIGSRLWLLKRQKLTTKVAIKAEDYARESLQWLLDDAVISELDVTAQIVFPARLYLTITYLQPSGQASTLRYGWVWEK